MIVLIVCSSRISSTHTYTCKHTVLAAVFLRTHMFYEAVLFDRTTVRRQNLVVASRWALVGSSKTGFRGEWFLQVGYKHAQVKAYAFYELTLNLSV